jgi:hypothetical protein
MDSLKKTARLAGALYMLVVLIGPFVLLYVPGKLFVRGDASATVSNILTHETLFRAHIVLGVVSQLAFIGAVLALYLLLEGVDRRLAGLMVILILIDAPLAFLGVANEVATLTFARGADFLAVFDQPQRDAMVTLLMQFDRQGALVSQVLWGLWLLPLGLLVRRSGFLPRLLGIWLFVNGVTYVLLSATALLAPGYQKTLFTLATPILFGEAALALWLLVFGVRVRRGDVAVA